MNDMLIFRTKGGRCLYGSLPSLILCPFGSNAHERKHYFSNYSIRLIITLLTGTYTNLSYDGWSCGSVRGPSEPPNGTALWKEKVVMAAAGYDSGVSASTSAIREARGRHLYEALLSRDVVELVATNRFKDDPEWGKLLERVKVGNGTPADQDKLNTRNVKRLPVAVASEFALAPLISSFNAEVHDYNESTSEIVAERRGVQVCSYASWFTFLRLL